MIAKYVMMNIALFGDPAFQLFIPGTPRETPAEVKLENGLLVASGPERWTKYKAAPAWRHGLNHGKIIEKHQDTVSNEDLSHGCPLALILLYLTFLREVCVRAVFLYAVESVELSPSCVLYRQHWLNFKCCSHHVVNMLILNIIPNAPHVAEYSRSMLELM